MKKITVFLVLSIIYFFFHSSLVGQELSTLFPKDGQVLYQKNVQLQWNSFSNAKLYTIHIDTNRSFSTKDTVVTNLTSYSFELDTTFNSRYYFFVTTLANGVQNFSDTISFIYFKPLNLSNISLWVSADKGVIINNNQVAQWQDQSNNNNHLSIASASKRPQLVDSSINNLPTIFFDATDDGLSSPLVISSGDYLMTAVYNSYDSANDIRRTVHGANNWLMGKYSTVHNIFAGGFTGGKPFVPFKFVVQSASYKNGTLKNTINSINYGSFLTTVVPGQVGLGSWSGSNRMNGEIAEWIVYTGMVTDSIQRIVEKYLMDKYAPPINLGKDISTCNFPIILDAYENYIQSYQWSTTSSDSSITIHSAGMYHLTTTDIFGRSFTDTILISLDTADASVNLMNDSTICKGMSLTVPAGPSHYQYSWNTGDTSSSIQVDSAGLYIVNRTNCLSNTTSDSIIVTVNHPKFNLGVDTNICFYSSLILEPDSNISVDYLWNTGATSPSIQVDSSGTYILNVVDPYNCSYRDSIHVQVDSILYNVSLGADTSLCEGNKIGVKNVQASLYTYHWNTGSLDSSIVVDTSGIYSVNISANNCHISDSIFVSIKGLAPQVDFNFQNLCFGDSVAFSDSSYTLDNSNIVDWIWEFGNGGFASDTNPVHKYDSVGSYQVKLTLSTDSGCLATMAKNINISPLPNVDFQFGSICEGTPIVFTDNSSISSDSIVSYNWHFGINSPLNGATDKDPLFLYDTSGTFQVSLKLESNKGCVDSLQKSVTVDPAPQVKFKFDGTCAGDSTTFTNQSSIATGSISSYEWNLGNGINTSKVSPKTLYTATGSYTIYLRATSNKGCQTTSQDTLVINPLPQINFLGSDFCEGAPIELVFQSSSTTDSIINYNYIFNQTDTSRVRNPIFSSRSVGTYPVFLKVESLEGCTNSIQKNINVRANPKAQFSILNNNSGAPLRIQIENKSTGASFYEWDFGNGDFDFNKTPDYTYLDTGSYTIGLVVTSNYGCTDSMKTTLNVLPAFLDAQLNEIYIEKINGFYTVSGRIINAGTSNIENILLKLNSNDGVLLSHFIEDNLFSGKSVAFEFPNSFSSFRSIEYVCVDIELVNNIQDAISENNILCKSTLGNELKLYTYPNPSTSQLTIEMILPNAGAVSLVLYDYTGKEIRKLLQQHQTEGFHRNTFDVSKLSPGVYFYSLYYQGKSTTKSFVKH